MSITLILEHAPHTQRETRRSYLGGQLVIGRGDECDWRLDDPDMFVSRKHCIITDEGGKVAVIDASRGGVFVDGSANPIGSGNALPLEHQMRIRLGDFVIRVDMEVSEARSGTSNPKKQDSIFDFGPTETKPSKPAERPKDLPDPFGLKPGTRDRTAQDTAPKPPLPLDRPDPFALNLNTAAVPRQETAKPAATGDKRSYFDEDPAPAARSAPASPEPDEPFPPIEITLDTQTERRAPNPPSEAPAPQTVSQSDQDLRSALYRGLGLSEKDAAAATPEEIEAIGARLRDCVDGLMFLMRTRAQERQKIRVAQTIISNADVNPLKFLASTDEALLALIRRRDSSYLSGDKAVPGAFRDLADHQVRTWSALQTALRRMIDNFDPAEVERELADTGLLEKLVAGGRSAKMWQLYQERYREIAKAAEERFLGEVGADFRDAYETKRS